MRPRRQILSNEVYEICMRTQRGLPFVCTLYMKLLLEGTIARVQRDHKVVLCHYLWMNNHPHIIAVAKDSKQVTAFYGEVQKQLTEAVKKLLGKEHLNLWKKNGTSVIPYGDLESVADRIAYLYANPSSANLVDRIEHYPGVSTWEAFQASGNELETVYKKTCPWVQAPMIDKLPRRALSTAQDLALTHKLRAKAKKKHTLHLFPNAWMGSFDVSREEDIDGINRSIVADLRRREEASREKRARKGWKTKGAARLKQEPLSLDYTPKKESRRIFVYAKDKNIRITMIEDYKRFCEKCSECYQKWKAGDLRVQWPPGAFPPAPPPLANYFFA